MHIHRFRVIVAGIRVGVFLIDVFGIQGDHIQVQTDEIGHHTLRQFGPVIGIHHGTTFAFQQSHQGTHVEPVGKLRVVRVRIKRLPRNLGQRFQRKKIGFVDARAARAERWSAQLVGPAYEEPAEVFLYHDRGNIGLETLLYPLNEGGFVPRNMKAVVLGDGLEFGHLVGFKLHP